MNNRLTVTKWESGSAFTLDPKAGFGFGVRRFSAACLKKFRDLRERITGELLAQFGTLRPELVRLAVNEAEALAANTPFPALFLPTLAEEKVLNLSRWQTKQQRIQERSFLMAA